MIHHQVSGYKQRCQVQELAEGSTTIGQVADLEARVAELEAQGRQLEAG